MMKTPHNKTLKDKDGAIQYVQELLNQARKNKKDEDAAKLENIIHLLNTKKYGLVWEEHAEKVEEEMKTKIPVFVEDESKKISDNPDSEDYNFLLEGDNLHSLHLLEKTHLGKIDVIYIDPPYNTGNKDFKYNDDFVDSEDTFRHSKWLSFMERRLKIANRLLKNDGIIFISIGDEEFAQLKLLCDEIFGSNAFKENIMVEISSTTGMKVGTAKKGGIVKNGEYILVYSKSDLVSTNRKPLYDFVPGFDTHFSLFLSDDGSISKTVDEIRSIPTLVDEINRLKSDSEKFTLKTFSKYLNNSSVLMDFVTENVHKFVRLRTEVPAIPDTTISSLEEGKWIKWRSLKRKEPYYLTLYEGKPANLATMESTYHYTDNFKPIYGRSIIRGDYWKEFWIDMGNIGKEGGVSFKNGKKPVRLIKQLLKWSNRPEGIVLDFFAGSGTTGDAVSQMNDENTNYNQKFILATNNENNIAEEVTYKRMKSVSTGTGNYGAHPMNLKYFKTDFVIKEEFPDVSLEYELLKYVTPLVELEFGIDITNPKVQIVLNEEQLESLIDNKELISNSTIFMHPDVFVDAETESVFRDKNITKQDIPHYYFRNENKK